MGVLDVWEAWTEGAWVVVPTNQMTRRDNTAVMGAGLARQAADRFPELPAQYGAALLRGEAFVCFPQRRVLLAPTKTDWREPSTLELVSTAVDRLHGWASSHPEVTHVVVPLLGCGRGGLNREDVGPLLARLPNPPFSVVSND